MRILHLTAGAGPMYCGSCLHSNTLARALRNLGEDVVLAPVYTPLRTDEENVSIDRLSMGGINVYLQESSLVFRWMPAFFRQVLDRPALVQWAARHGARTRPERLGSLTVSVLRGDDGPLRREIDKLTAWLATDVRPEVIHLSNVMLAGLARPLAARLGVPVVATLSGEDGFLEKLPASSCATALAVLREKAADLAALVAMNDYYAQFMSDYLTVPRDRIHVIHAGLDLQGHRKPDQPHPNMPAGLATIGLLGRVCPEKGLHLLVEAFETMTRDPSLPSLRVRVAGYLDDADRPYLAALEQRLAQRGLADRFEYLGELDRPAKIAFLQSLDVLCLPATTGESKGLPVLEAWANGVPAVLPALGPFPEMIERTGGGLLHKPCDADSLADGLSRMIHGPHWAAQCGRRAHRVVHEHYHAERMARETLDLYRHVCNRS